MVLRPGAPVAPGFLFCDRRAGANTHRMTVTPLGDAAVVVTLGASADAAMVARVRALAAELERHPIDGVGDLSPAFASLALFLDPLRAPRFEVLRAELETRVQRADAAIVSVEPRTVEIPVYYGGEYGPDLQAVAMNAKIAPNDVVAQHSAGDYLVQAIGFTPGFPYLGGLPPELAMPRRATPRPQVPAGSVAIGGSQTGIYPLQSPGGWNVIGRTPLILFDPNRAEPALLRTGDRVKFRAFDAGDFQSDAPPLSEIPAVPNGQLPHRIEVIRGGMLTTVQDLGRMGHRSVGVPLSGAADPFALRLVNALVGNADHAAAIEFTLVGPTLRFSHDTVIAVGGGDFGDLPRWRPLRISAGTELNFGPARHGCRGYLAVAGGVEIPPVLGSRSTYLRAALGGLAGRVLRQGDVLPVSAVRRNFRDHWRIDERILPAYSNSPVVRVIRGRHADQFASDWAAQSFQVSVHSDRMGIRLAGSFVARKERADLLSSPVVPGTVQVPPDGLPILLLADAQTIGGYPQLCHVISVDMPLVAQLRPGDTLRFQIITLEEAVKLRAARERALGLLHEGLAQKLA